MFWKNIQQLFRDLRHQKLRTVLTLFGIIWGAVAIILLLTFGEAFYAFSLKASHGMGEGICIMWGGRTSKPYQGFNRGRYIRFQESDIRVMRQQIPELGEISPEYSRNVRVRVGTEGYSANLSAVYPEFQQMRNMIAAEGGRFLNQLDMKQRRRVVFIGDQVEEDLFGIGEALGESIYINAIPFQVIGVLKPKIQNSNYNGGDDGRILIPASTYRGIYGDRYLSNMVYRATDVRFTEQLKDKVYQVLGKRHKFDPTDREALAIWDTSGNEKFFKTFFSGFIIFLGIVGGMTLIVGGIGVSNIMNVVVEERTREIGIKKALGAKKRYVLGQYLMETLVITGIGGVIGYSLSTAIVFAGNMFPIQEFVGVLQISPLVSAITIIVLGAIGLIAGWFPARRAANLDPVIAIRK
ncbi:MAG: ABC transporter permease [Candidatus Marinimicrobia bacterium]|nr:ABC transporter permease [Candidatus Neomarinimicrobiota bacterium]MCF7828627.1 ABC transporter permease [Candidatus Neomarinimicrobiota bacterium]MCF7880368.1 ABC transporter permease [Candidatus Neomarinimicrobiota bacterium]